MYFDDCVAPSSLLWTDFLGLAETLANASGRCQVLGRGAHRDATATYVKTLEHILSNSKPAASGKPTMAKLLYGDSYSGLCARLDTTPVSDFLFPKYVPTSLFSAYYPL